LKRKERGDRGVGTEGKEGRRRKKGGGNKKKGLERRRTREVGKLTMEDRRD